MFKRGSVFNIVIPIMTDHKEAATPESVSGMATPGTYLIQNSAIHTEAAKTETMKVNIAILFLDARTKYVVIRNIENGKSAKKATDT